MQDYEERYEETWRTIVENPDGTLNRDQVMRELFDFTTVMTEASKVYEELAGLTKPNTAAEHVLEGADRKYREQYADLLCERAYDLLGDAVDPGDASTVERIAEAMKALAEEWHPGSWDEYLRGREAVAALVACRGAEQ